MIKILLIEDDLEFAELISDFLKSRNILCSICDDPFKALVLNLNNYDLVLLDLGVPGIDGLEVCKEFWLKSNIPIIISSARNTISDKISALQIGADDYLPKPYDPDELYARVISLLKRTKNSFITKQSSDFEIDNNLRDIKYKNNSLLLTEAEYEVFETLLKNSENITSKEQLINSSKSIQSENGKSLEMIISKIRSKIKKYSSEKHIISIRNRGYKVAK